MLSSHLGIGARSWLSGAVRTVWAATGDINAAPDASWSELLVPISQIIITSLFIFSVCLLNEYWCSFLRFLHTLESFVHIGCGIDNLAHILLQQCVYGEVGVHGHDYFARWISYTMPFDRARDGDEFMAASAYDSAHVHIVQCFWCGCMVRLECIYLPINVHNMSWWLRSMMLCDSGLPAMDHFWSTFEGTAMKSGLGTSPKSFFIISPCYQVQHGGYN